MTIENSDRLLVNRGSTSHQITYEKIKDNILEAAQAAVEDAPNNGKQYGRQDSTWTEIVHTEEYTDADVDAHLNTNLANGGQILSWNGSDYQWVADQTGGGGGSSDASLVSYQYPGGVSRSVENRLEDYVSVKDFGAVGNGSTDDTTAFQAAIDTGKKIHIPAGTYLLTGTISSSGRNVHFSGDGSRNTVLNFRNGSINGFSVDIDNGGNADYTAQFSGFRINSNAQQGTAIYIKSNNPVGEIFPMAIVDDIHVDGNWKRGIDLDSVRVCRLRNITLGLPTGEEGIALRGKCMDSVLSNIIASNLLRNNGAAIYIDGEAEGIHVEQSTIINCQTGIQMECTTGEPSLFVSDTHTNTRRYGIKTVNVVQMNLHDNLFYAYTGSDGQPYVGVYVEKTSGGGGFDSVISNNIFHGAGRTGGGGRWGVFWKSEESAIIADNVFMTLEVGIEANDGNLAYVASQNNQFRMVTNPYSVDSGNIAASDLVSDFNGVSYNLRNVGSREKEVAIQLENQNNYLKIMLEPAAGTNNDASFIFENALNFYQQFGGGGLDQILSLKNDRTADFQGNVIVRGGDLYLKETGGTNLWILTVDSNGNLNTQRA